jgi:thiosulfate dehydrogenase
VRYLIVLVVAAAACDRAVPGAPGTGVASDSSILAPDGSTVPDGELGRSIRRGHAILAATPDSLPIHVGAALRCTSCHLGDGRQRNALPLTGVYARFPQYRARTGAVQRLEDRVNDCLLRSMNGSALALDDAAMRDIIAYLAFISRGTVVEEARSPAAGASLTTEGSTGDTIAGAQVYRAQCVRCHGSDGAGVAPFPPLWGKTSFNIGAGMARLRTAATFIRHNMPQDRAESLSDLDALNVAAYVTSRPRPDFAGKDHDWPNGDAPPDAPYPTIGVKHPLR